MKFASRIVLSLFIGISLLIYPLITPNIALADGMVIHPDPDSDRWDYLGEDNQQAFINYEHGLQKMILSIGMEESEGDSVWIFPVPAEPDRVIIDVLTDLPQFWGSEVDKLAKSKLSGIKTTLTATQIYTIPYYMFRTVMPYRSFQEILPGFDAVPLAGKAGLENDVIVYEHLEKEGVITEIITAKTAEGLYQYLQGKDLKIEEGSIPVLDNYIGQEFTFVVSWILEGEMIDSPVPIEDDDEVWIQQPSGSSMPDVPGTIMPPPRRIIKKISKQKGVFVTFPTDKIYYPLLPTSVYESKVVPATIRVMGFVSPEVFEDIKSYTKVSYFVNNPIRILPGLESFYNANTRDVQYTKIEIDAPSKMLTDDLWINNRIPFKVSLASFISQHPAISTIFWLFLCSVLAGLLAGVIIFREDRNSKGIIKFGWLGMANCLSLAGLVVATVFAKTREIGEEEKGLLSGLKQKGLSVLIQQKDPRKWAFVPLFSVLFLIITWVTIELVRLGL